LAQVILNVVARILLLALLIAGGVWPQQQKEKDKQPPKPAPQQQEQEPPEEDENLKPREYSFNPLEAEHDFKVGNYYFKKGNFKAARNRFKEATLWNPTYADAYLRLGDSEEKLKDKQASSDAYAKYLELAPDGKAADAIKKKLAGKR
jgi:tetratricopeptide (TPR) repeat protein